jgi:ABC-type multidrug transport system permease subunit
MNEFMMRNPLIQLILINYREFVREPGIVFWSVIFPVLMSWVLGVAFSSRGELAQTIAVLESSPRHNLQLRAFLETADTVIAGESGKDHEYRKSIPNDKLGNTSYRFMLTSWEEAVLMLKRGQTAIIIEGKPDSLLFHFDPKNPEARLNYLTLTTIIKDEAVIRKTESIKVLEKTGTRYIDFLIPGLLAMGIMNSFLWGISYGLIEMRAKKLLRRMIATPMKKSAFLISHFVARVSLAIFEACILYLFARIYFKIEIQGSIVALIMIFFAGNLCFTGIGVLLASRTSSSRIGAGLINFISLPMTVLSGVFFSYHNFPDFVIPFIQKLPLTMLADSFRSIFTEGAGIADNLASFIILSGLGMFCFIIGMRIYKWY